MDIYDLFKKNAHSFFLSLIEVFWHLKVIKVRVFII